VVNAATGEPLPRALVTLQSSPARTAFSDSNGGFSIDGVSGGRFTISAQKPGYFGQQEREGSFRAPQIIEVGPKTDAITITLAPESVISGRLMDPNEQPIESVGVRLIRAISRNGKLRWESRGYASSDEDGAFRFANLQPGTYYLSAGPEVSRANSMFTEPEQPHTGWPGVYYPGVPDIGSAAPIHVAAGQQVEANLTMNRVPLYAVAGMVSGIQPAQGVTLQVQSPSGDTLPVATQFSSDTGLFDIRLPAGMYRLRAMSQAGEQQLRAELRISVNKDLTQLHLPLQPAATIPIHARMENGAQETVQWRGAGRRADAGDEMPPLSVRLLSTEPGGTDAYSTVKGARGGRSLVILGIEPGRYTAEISPYGGWYVESAQCGNANLLAEDLVITAGGGCSMELSLRNDPGTLSLELKYPDEAAATAGSGAALLVPTHGGTPRIVPYYVRTTKSPQGFSAAGTSSSSSVAPGEYTVYAFDDINAVEYLNPEAMRPYASQGVPVTISPGETAKVKVQIIQTGADTH
jgi:hypothetical protein